MPSNEFVGSITVVQWQYAGGTISMYDDARTFTYTPSIDFIDATAGTDTARRRIKSFADGQAQISMLAQTDGTLILQKCVEGAYGTLVWGPAGTAAGRPKKTIAAYCGGVRETYPYADISEWTITWSQDGPRTDGTW